MLVPTTHRVRRASRLRTPHDVIVAVPVGRLELLHRAVLVRSHAGKVPADGPLPLAARVHPSVGSAGTVCSPGRTSRGQSRPGGFRRGQRGGGHLTKQITEIVHCGMCSWRNVSSAGLASCFANRLSQGTDKQFPRRFGRSATRKNRLQTLHYQHDFHHGYHNNWHKQKVNLISKNKIKISGGRT